MYCNKKGGREEAGVCGENPNLLSMCVLESGGHKESYVIIISHAVILEGLHCFTSSFIKVTKYLVPAGNYSMSPLLKNNQLSKCNSI